MAKRCKIRMVASTYAPSPKAAAALAMAMNTPVSGETGMPAGKLAGEPASLRSVDKGLQPTLSETAVAL